MGRQRANNGWRRLHACVNSSISCLRCPLPGTAAEAYGTIRAQLESKGETIGNNDLWIAAHAIAVGLTLVTNDEGEFRRVRGLKIQNWAV